MMMLENDVVAEKPCEASHGEVEMSSDNGSPEQKRRRGDEGDRDME